MTSEDQKATVVLRMIANIAHHGGLIGFKTDESALMQIRDLSLDWWDESECARLQKPTADTGTEGGV